MGIEQLICLMEEWDTLYPTLYFYVAVFALSNEWQIQIKFMEENYFNQSLIGRVSYLHSCVGEAARAE